MTTDAIVTAADDSLVLGLRALATLARRGPLDVQRLARLQGSRAQRLAAVVEELERDGLVHRLTDRALVAVTVRGAALIDGMSMDGAGPWLH